MHDHSQIEFFQFLAYELRQNQHELRMEKLSQLSFITDFSHTMSSLSFSKFDIISER
jgi:hypothetical protein